ncbi:hypothetical protein [Micromonospora sp. NPDC005367]|uniref:hypothetical protein n=1 Tax=Micromonospora sp. NPDC005367 TaxID=3155590 RepID=UPI0033AFAC6C
MIRYVFHLRLDDVQHAREVQAPGFAATPSVVSAQPALATTGPGSANQATRSSSECGFLFTT